MMVADLQSARTGSSCFFREGDGPLWRGVAPATDADEYNLSFRRFDPQTPLAPLWRDFSEDCHWSLTQQPHDSEHLRESTACAWPESQEISDSTGWQALCALADQALALNEAGKLVLARSTSSPLTEYEAAQLSDHSARRLFAPSMPTSFRFWILRGQSLFFGASPELLFRREGNEIFVPAIAGTRALGTGDSDEALQKELLASPKERAEHQVVVRGIMETLRSLGLKARAAAEPKVVRVPRLLHLFTPIHAENDPQLSSERLLERLHPTPAICGYPQQAALAFLRAHEGWDRGLFAAPILVRLPGKELCLVAIRSALLTQQKLVFFAGAGYVKGSTAALEWAETEKKLQVMKTILFGDSHERN